MIYAVFLRFLYVRHKLSFPCVTRRQGKSTYLYIGMKTKFVTLLIF